MNRTFFIGIVVSLLLLSSCGQKKEMTYNAYESPNKSYSIEIPSSAVQGKCFADFMSFEDKASRLIISVRHVEESSLNGNIHSEGAAEGGFTYSLFHSSDTTTYYKITKGNNMWSAYELYMLKRMKGRNYIIQVSSDKFGQSEMVEMIKHIHSSMKQHLAGKEDAIAREDGLNTMLGSSYSNKYYAIKYPKGWKVIEHLDEMTNVYIGSEVDNFGFTIVRFETDYTLSEINKEGNESLRQAGFKIKEDKLIILRGMKCYRAIHETNVQNQEIKQISYTFKKGNMLYNIKFGSVTTKAQETLAAKITESFYFK